MTREEAIRIFRKEIECMSHTKCSDCILEKVCDPISTTPLDSEYIEAFGMAIEALSAIEDIKAEIAEYKDDKIIHLERNEMVDNALEIIDRHIGGKESE